jgi:tRNA modification GTPase
VALQLKHIFPGKGVRPGEPKRNPLIFLNDKLDLAQAEAIADLIDASSEQAARSALNSLQETALTGFGADGVEVGHHLVQLGFNFAVGEEINFFLAGREAAIVTDIAGTTRDVLREHIHIDGMPLHIILP